MSEIGYLKKCEIYSILIIISIIAIIILAIYTSYSTSLTNSTSYSLVLGFKIYDLGAIITLSVGILAFFAALYTADKNYKATKFSSLPDRSVNLLIDLKFAFNEYENDEFILLTMILKNWKDHQKAFLLLTPYFYKEFLKIATIEYDVNKIKILTTETTENKTLPKVKIDYSNPNSGYILNALIAQITNIAFENDECYFEFISPHLIEDKRDIEELGENLDNYKKIKINKSELKNYFNNIKGPLTKQLANDEFKKLDQKIKKLTDNLKKEIEEYD